MIIQKFMIIYNFAEMQAEIFRRGLSLAARNGDETKEVSHNFPSKKSFREL